MKKYLLLIASLWAMCAYGQAPVQDGDSKMPGSYTQSVDFADPETGLKFAIKSYDPCYMALMNSTDILMESRVLDLDYYPDDEEYMNMPAGEYSGDIEIPDFVQHDITCFFLGRISYGAFSRCTGLTSVSIPQGVGDVRRGAFYGCTALREVRSQSENQRIQPGCAVFYPDVFRGCTSLQKVDLTMALDLIGGIFADCPALEEVTMFCHGNQANAFLGRQVPSLKKINLLAYAFCPPAEYEANDGDPFFEEEYQNTVVSVPKDYIEQIRNHPLWGRFLNIVETDASERIVSSAEDTEL